jgi:phosphoribosylformylglycinamidine cyclo-ligase
MTTRYRQAGVDIDAANASVSRIADMARATFGPGAAHPIGHFGGTFHLPAAGDRMLVASADGIGTKLKLAFILGGAAHARVGGDLVNHCVNDILTLGAQPLFFLDYVAMGTLDREALEGLVGGMADACRTNGVALIGGETAEMPGMYAAGEYDAAGFIVGEVAPEAAIDGTAVRAGDMLIGLPSSGLHTNGYSLARAIVGLTGDLAADLERLEAPLPGGDGVSLGEALLAPHLSYLAAVSPLLGTGKIHGMAHITGGGLIDNVPRMLPERLAAEFDPGTWLVPPVFTHLCEAGGVDATERYRAFNMGLGFVLAVAASEAAAIVAELNQAADAGARTVGQVVTRPDAAGPTVLGLPGPDAP